MVSIDPETAEIAAPLISVVMANYQAGDKLIPAIESVLRQSVSDLELIVCDDASGDHSVDLIERFVRSDPRVRLIRADTNGGPARCRNSGLEAAQGRWIAVVDSDDIIHPERFERLLAAAHHFDVDIVADDLLHFYEDGSPPTLLLAASQDTPLAITPEQWISDGVDGSPPLGYLKPLIRAETLGAQRYNETLRIGEDYDLMLRLLLAGAAMTLIPEPYYLYRRHSGSISHRLAAADLAAMIDSQDAMTGRSGSFPPSIAMAFAARRAQLHHGLEFARLIEAIKARDAAEALSLLARNPRLAPRLWQSFAEGRSRKATPPPVHRPMAAMLTLGQPGQPIPDYVPAASIDWSAPCPRQAWLDLAELSRGRPIDVVCITAAARYAAGFIPLARVRETAAHPDLAELVP